MGLRVASDGPAGRVGWACGSRRMGPLVASDHGPAGRFGWAGGSRQMGRRVGWSLRVLLEVVAGTANRAEEGNAVRTWREERLESLDWQGSERRADAEIATWTTWTWQRRTLSRKEEGGAEGKGLVSALPAGRRTKEESAAFVGLNSALAGSES